MSHFFKKLFLGALVAVKSGFGWMNLTRKKYDITPQPLEGGKIDTTKWGLPPGKYKINIVACSEGLEESKKSNNVILYCKIINNK